MIERQHSRPAALCVMLGITALSLGMCSHDSQVSVLAPSRPPSVAALSPTSGSVGTDVAVTGEGFTSSTNTIRFGAGYINGLNSSDGVTLRFTVPQGQNLCPPTNGLPSAVGPCPGAYPRVTPGSYTISVMNANGASNDLTFTVKDQ
jgi:hypothetical protein